MFTPFQFTPLVVFISQYTVFVDTHITPEFNGLSNSGGRSYTPNKSQPILSVYIVLQHLVQ